MSSSRDGKPTKGDGRVIVSAATVRDECTFMVRRIPTLVAPEVTSRKKQFDIIARMTGISARRVKDYWRGEINDPPGSQDRTIRNAYRAALQKWKETALAQLEQMDGEHEENLRAAAGYASERFKRACGAVGGAREVVSKEASAADP